MRTIRIKGMSCTHCVAVITRALKEIEGIEEVEKAISEAGYEFLGSSEGREEDPLAKARNREIRELRIKAKTARVIRDGREMNIPIEAASEHPLAQAIVRQETREGFPRYW